LANPLEAPIKLWKSWHFVGLADEFCWIERSYSNNEKKSARPNAIVTIPNRAL
jgi:hypothetical protein